MKSEVFILEVLTGEASEVFMLRNGQGKMVKATQNADEFLDFLRYGEPEVTDEEFEDDGQTKNS